MPMDHSPSVSYSRHAIEVVQTDEFETWLKKLRDVRGKARIIRRLDRLAQGNRATFGRSAKDSRNCGSMSGRAIASTSYKTETL